MRYFVNLITLSCNVNLFVAKKTKIRKTYLNKLRKLVLYLEQYKKIPRRSSLTVRLILIFYCFFSVMMFFFFLEWRNHVYAYSVISLVLVIIIVRVEKSFDQEIIILSIYYLYGALYYWYVGQINLSGRFHCRHILQLIWDGAVNVPLDRYNRYNCLLINRLKIFIILKTLYEMSGNVLNYIWLGCLKDFFIKFIQFD